MKIVQDLTVLYKKSPVKVIAVSLFILVGLMFAWYITVPLIVIVYLGKKFKKEEESKKNTKKKCPHCQTEIDWLASICPNCHGKISVWTADKKILATVFILVVLIGFMKIDLSSDNISSTPTSTDNTVRVEEDDTKDKLDQVNKTLPSIIEKRQRLAILYADGEIEHDDYKKVLIECKAQEEQLRQDQLRLERKLLTRKEIKGVANIIDEQYKKLLERIDSLTYNEKQEAMRLMLRRIIVYPKRAEAEIEFNFNPGEEMVVSPFLQANDIMLRDNGAKTSPTISSGIGDVSQLRDSSVG